MSQSEEPPEELEETEKVGYCNPPKEKQFKKGQSGNPGGRPKRPPFQMLFQEILSEDITMTMPDGEKVCMSKLEAMIQKWVTQCIKGDEKARKQFMNALKFWDQIYPI